LLGLDLLSIVMHIIHLVRVACSHQPIVLLLKIVLSLMSKVSKETTGLGVDVSSNISEGLLRMVSVGRSEGRSEQELVDQGAVAHQASFSLYFLESRLLFIILHLHHLRVLSIDECSY
jgi:hypothetical protein